MFFFERGDEVIKRLKDGGMFHGFVLAPFKTLSGIKCCICQTKQGMLFISEDALLEVVNLKTSKITVEEVDRSHEPGKKITYSDPRIKE